MQLNLNKIGNGSYYKNLGAIKITLTNPFVYLGEGSNAWQLTIEVEGLELISEYFGTKKQASQFGAAFINSL
tara:strand:+ start:142 stop:357 length:216 start_codon:yes stop_codon:yes gene_type:complete